ncbi:MAG: hypothetical protein WC389_19050 [Lutibacter sp.]|jgi:hypothetical protein
MIIVKCKNKIERNNFSPITADFNDLIELVKNPVQSTKDASGLLLPYALIDNDAYPIKDNFKTYEAIFLDVENTVDIKYVENKLKGIQHVLYTSYSHSPDNHRFRVILPVKEPLAFDEFDTQAVKQTLYQLFPYTDNHTFDARGFHEPVITPDYYSCHCDGKLFDFYHSGFRKMVRDNAIKINTAKPIIIPIKTTKPKSAKPKSARNRIKVTQYMNAVFPNKNGNGNSNKWLFVAICCCIGCHDNQTLADVTRKARLEGWTEKEINYKIQCANNRRK